MQGLLKRHRKLESHTVSEPRDKSADIRIDEPVGGWTTATRRTNIASILILIIITLLIYSNTLHVPFIEDDKTNIRDNPLIKDPGLLLKDMKTILLTNRLIPLLSFHLNYRIFRNDIAWYHIINILIHMANSVLIYYLIIMIYRSDFIIDYNLSSFILSSQANAFFIAILFAVHPIQTESVTYIVQRYNLLVSLFMLVSLILYIKMLKADTLIKKIIYYTSFIMTAFLAVKSKESALLLPILILTLHIFFYKGILKDLIINIFMLLIIILIIPIGIYMYCPGSLGEMGIINDAIQSKYTVLNTASSNLYIINQLRVIVTYLGLLFFPINLHLDHSYDIIKNIYNVKIIISFIIISSIIFIGMYAYSLSHSNNRRLYRLTSFGILWFFLFLSLHSLTMSTNLIVEHRLYFSSVGFLIFLMTAITILAERVGETFCKVIAIALIVWVVILSITTFRRNIIWQSEITIWKDSVEKSPDNARGHFNLGISYLNNGMYADAVKEFRNTVSLYKNNVQVFQSMEQIKLYLAISLRKNKEYDSAIKTINNILIGKDFTYKNNLLLSDYYNELGNIYVDLEKYGLALEQYNLALTIDPTNVRTHINRGNAYIKNQQIDDAISDFNFVSGSKKDDPEIHYVLGSLYKDKLDYEMAIAEFMKAIKLNSRHINSYISLGHIYIVTKQFAMSESCLLEVISLQPMNTEARINLAYTYMAMGSTMKAEYQLNKVLEIDPNNSIAMQNLLILSTLRNKK